MILPHKLQKEVREALDVITEKHQQCIKVICNTLDSLGGKVSPQKQLLESLNPCLLAADLPVLDEKQLTEYIRKYERVGFFERTVGTEDRRQNILVLTKLGRSLVLDMNREKLAGAALPVTQFTAAEAKPAWAKRTLWKLETFIRQKRSLQPGIEIPIATLTAEIIQKRTIFDLQILKHAESAERFLRAVLIERFAADELYLSETAKTLKVLRKLS